MAATRGYFEDNTLNVQNGDTTDKILIPTHLAEYGSTTGQIAAKFKLDIVLPHHAGFLGGIKVSGSSNLMYHNTHNKNIDGTANSKGDNTSNPNRLSKLRIYKDGTEYALFNDGGVNIKPECTFWGYPDTINGDPFLLWGGKSSEICVMFTVRRFAYNRVRQVKLYRGTTLIGTFDCGTQMYDADESVNKAVIVKANCHLNANETIKAEVLCENEEGTISYIESQGVGREVDLPIFADYYDADDGVFRPENPTSVESVFKFTSDDLSSITVQDNATGIFLYTDIRMNKALSTAPNTPPTGWYRLGDKTPDGLDKFYRVDNNGEVRKYMTKGSITSSKVFVTPYLLPNGNIGIEISNESMPGSVTVTSITYYDSKDATNSVGNAQTINKTISGLSVGDIVDTGITMVKAGNYARFGLSTTIGYSNPIVLLMDNNFTPK